MLRAAHAGLRSRTARWLLSAWLAVPLYLAAFYGLYLANLADPILSTVTGHTLLEVGFLVAGMLFTIPILSSDPLPVRMSHGGRALDVFAEAALHAFFGVFLMMAPVVVAFMTSTHDAVAVHLHGLQVTWGGHFTDTYKEVLTKKGGFTGEVTGARMVMNSFILGVGFAVGA